MAARIGAANTLVRQQDGSLKAYNTDWSAAIEAIEEGLGGRFLSPAALVLLSIPCSCPLQSDALHVLGPFSLS